MLCLCPLDCLRTLVSPFKWGTVWCSRASELPDVKVKSFYYSVSSCNPECITCGSPDAPRDKTS